MYFVCNPTPQYQEVLAPVEKFNLTKMKKESKEKKSKVTLKKKN